jgi:hypothetical protein
MLAGGGRLNEKGIFHMRQNWQHFTFDLESHDFMSNLNIMHIYVVGADKVHYFFVLHFADASP